MSKCIQFSYLEKISIILVLLTYLKVPCSMKHAINWAQFTEDNTELAANEFINKEIIQRSFLSASL